MPCPHKFIQDLNLQRLDFEPTRLVVGTFNPAWPPTNTAQWFYGRTSNNYFWDVVPKLQGKGSLINAGPTQWKAFCKQHKIAITDLISCINDANSINPQHVEWLSDYTDKNIATKFHSFNFNNIVQLLQSKSSIKKVYLTRGTDETFWRRLWKPVENYCASNGIVCNTLFTPSANARYQASAFIKQNPTKSLSDYILQRWQPKW